MKKILLFLMLILLSCSSSKHSEINEDGPLINYLTNDSIKFWETDMPIQNKRWGLYFTKSRICDEYRICKNLERELDREGDVNLDMKFYHFKLKQDSLILYLGDSNSSYFRLHWFKILKLTADSLIVQETTGPYKPFSNKRWTATYRYFAPKDQQTKPK